MLRIICFILILFTFNLNSQIQNSDANKLMLKGKVLSTSDKEPLDVKITFKENSGKEISTNSIDEKYELLLDANQKYDVFINGKNTIRYHADFIFESSENYIEAEKVFYVKIIEEGVVITHIIDAFEENSLNEKAREEFEEVKRLLRFNRNVYITFYLLTEDVNAPSANCRLDIIKEYVSDWKRFKDKIENFTIKNEYKDIDFNINNEDIVIIISSVKNPFGG